MTKKMSKEDGEPLAASTVNVPEASAVTDPLEPFNSRLPRSLQRRLKVHVALHDTKIQEVLGTALDEYLTRHGS